MFKGLADSEPTVVAFIAHAAATFIVTEALKYAGVHLDVTEVQAALLAVELPVLAWVRAKVFPAGKVQERLAADHPAALAALTRKP